MQEHTVVRTHEFDTLLHGECSLQLLAIVTDGVAEGRLAFHPKVTFLRFSPALLCTAA